MFTEIDTSEELDFERELKIPDVDLFSSFDPCTFPPLSPQVSAELLFSRKEKKEEEWKTCKKFSGGLLWSPCYCDDCEGDDSGDYLEDMNFLFPSPRHDLVLNKNYFQKKGHEDRFAGDNHYMPSMSLFEDPDLDYDEVLRPPRGMFSTSRRRVTTRFEQYKKRRRKRPRHGEYLVESCASEEESEFDYRPIMQKKQEEEKERFGESKIEVHARI